MTTATLTRPPTEADIRAAVEAQAKRWDLPDHSWHLNDDLWHEADFRPSEQERMDKLIDAALESLSTRFRHEVTEAIIAACVAFAAEYPDAPRAEVAS